MKSTIADIDIDSPSVHLSDDGTKEFVFFVEQPCELVITKSELEQILTEMDEIVAEFKQYRRKNIAEMRNYIPGEDMTGISLSEADKELPTLDGGKIARNPTNHNDTWYVAKVWFDDNFVEM